MKIEGGEAQQPNSLRCMLVAALARATPRHSPGSRLGNQRCNRRASSPSRVCGLDVRVLVSVGRGAWELRSALAFSFTFIAFTTYYVQFTKA